MIQQISNKATRKYNSQNTDVAYLSKYFLKNGKFPLFTQVLIETRTDCNNHCPFCPHVFNNKPLNIMKWDVYCKIINSLCSIGYNGRVTLMLSNEPLLEERLIDMIKYAKEKSPRLFLDITTNGILLSLKTVDNLICAGLDNINVNDYRGDRDRFPCKISNNLKEVYEAYSNNPKLTFQMRRFDEQLPNYGGNIPRSVPQQDLGFCNFPFRKLVIAYNGDILLCCNDFMYVTNYGNIITGDLIDCWNNSEFNKVRLALLEDKRISLCNHCNDFQDYKTF